MDYRKLLFVALLLLTSVGHSQSERPSAEEAFEQAIALQNAGDHENAIPLLQIALADYPDAPSMLWNLGTSALITERYDLAIQVWSRYRDIEPSDWQALAKLVQAHQGDGTHDLRDSVRKELLALYEVATDDSLSQQARYCREQYPLKDGRVYVYEYFAPLATEWAKFYEFIVTDEQGSTRFSVSLGSYDSTNSIDLELGNHREDERLYHFDAYYPDGGHSTLGFLTRTNVMDYDEAREAMMPMVSQLSQRMSTLDEQR